MDYQKQIAEIKSSAKFGDLIQFCYPIGYSHWAVYEKDGHVIHFALADENELMSSVRPYLQSAFPMSGDILLGQTKIRRMPIEEVNVPTGACVSIDNSSHKFPPSSKKDMRKRLNFLLDVVFTYDLFSCNCEHFVTFVRYGRAVCNQIPGRPQDRECEKATKLFQDHNPIASTTCKATKLFQDHNPIAFTCCLQ